MKLHKLLGLNRIFIDVDGKSKKHILEKASKSLAETIADGDYKLYLERFFAREKLGDTTTGKGIAVPSICCEQIESPLAVYLQLKKATDFSDGLFPPVDIVFALAFPDKNNEENCKLLHDIILRLSNDEFCHQLRAASTKIDIYKIFSEK
ncbi:MAG: PTS sugar transporter subunit IIA [Pseudomonadota bacterium]